MNAPLPRGFSTTGPHTVIGQEIRVPTQAWPTRVLRSHRRRRRGQRDADRVVHNHATERWMVSYADFITLLFAFFVVMYAMSSVNEGRYRVLSGVLSNAFSAADARADGAGAATKPAEVPAPKAAAAEEATVAVAAAAPIAEPSKEPPAASTEPPIDPIDRAEIAKTAARVQHMTELATRVDERLQSLVRDGQVQVTRGARGVAIEINAAVLFDPAKADLKPASFEALRTLASVLSGFVEPLQVEGHSDDVPIATREFKSNWELSAARAASVARFLIAAGIAPSRLGVAGYAEFRPLTGNVDAESRARNRRVTLLVLSADDPRPKEGAAPDPAAETKPSD